MARQQAKSHIHMHAALLLIAPTTKKNSLFVNSHVVFNTHRMNEREREREVFIARKRAVESFSHHHLHPTLFPEKRKKFIV